MKFSVVNKRCQSVIWCATLFTLLVFLTACTSNSVNKNTKLFSENIKHVHYLFSALPENDEEGFAKDLEYMRSISERGKEFHSDLSDDRQLRYVVRNLKRAGRSPQNAPKLFGSIAQLRAHHKKNGPPSKAILKTTTLKATTDERVPLNTITDLGAVTPAKLAAVGGLSSASTNYSTTGLSTIPEGTQSTLIYVQLFDASNNTPFGPGASNQQFGGGENIQATQTSSPPSAISNLGSALQVTYQATAKSQPVVVHKLLDSFGAPTAPPKVKAPKHVHSPADKKIKVCLSRDTGPDPGCDYGPYQNPTPNPIVQLPVIGSIEFGSAVDTSRIIAGTLYVWAENGGGACTLQLDAQQFSQAFTIDASNPKKLSWSFYHLSGATKVYQASFGLLNNNPCWTPDQPYGMTLSVDVPVKGTLFPETFFVTTTPGPVVANTTRISNLDFTWGCFKEGTEIDMADGSLRKIETIAAGEKVVADASGRTLTVTELSQGFEAEPMVVIKDEFGNNLSITDGHPIVIRGENGERRVALAKELTVGDVVFSSRNIASDSTISRVYAPAKITHIERKKHDGKVYNLYLGDASNGEVVTKNNTTMIANGILSGDNAMQEYFGAAFNFKPKAIKDRISAEWYRDYELYQKLLSDN